MTHGAVTSDRSFGAWLWEFAASRNDGIAVYAPAFLGEVLPASRRAPTPEQLGTDALVRVVGRVQPWAQEHARFEPSWQRPMSYLCRECVVHLHAGLVVPLSTADDTALNTLRL